MALAGRGLPVLAIQPKGKVPYANFSPNGAHSATTDVHIVSEWFERVPDLNFGIALPRLLVIDVDPRNGGVRSWANVVSEHGELPLSWRTHTGGGGMHYFFTAPKDGVGSKKLDGVDIKTGAGAYVIGAGSTHESGRRYAWDPEAHPSEVPLLPIPAELLQAVTGPKQNGAKQSAEYYAAIAGRRLVNGERNEMLGKLSAYLCCNLLYLDEDLILELLLGWSEGRCNQDDFGSDEVEHIVVGVIAREMRKRGML